MNKEEIKKYWKFVRGNGYQLYQFRRWNFGGAKKDYKLVLVKRVSKETGYQIIGYVNNGVLLKQEGYLEAPTLYGDRRVADSRGYLAEPNVILGLTYDNNPLFKEYIEHDTRRISSQLAKGDGHNGYLPVGYLRILARNDDEALNRVSKYLPNILRGVEMFSE